MNIWISLATIGIIQVNLLCEGHGDHHGRRIEHFQGVHDAEVDGPAFNGRKEDNERNDEGYTNRAVTNVRNVLRAADPLTKRVEEELTSAVHERRGYPYRSAVPLTKRSDEELTSTVHERAGYPPPPYRPYRAAEPLIKRNSGGARRGADGLYEARRLGGNKRVCKRVCKRSGGLRHCKREC